MLHLRKKISLLIWLMAASELLIALFVVRWLQAEYNSEKMLLQKNLFEQFQAARSGVMDSIISRSLVHPILEEASLPRMPPQQEVSQQEKTSYRVIAIDTTFDGLPQDTLQTKITLHQVQRRTSDEEVNIQLSGDTVDDRLYRGVKLFISRAGGTDRFFDRHLVAGDTTLLKKLFEDNLRRQKLSVKITWLKEARAQASAAPFFYFDSHFPDQPFAAVIENYPGVLMPHILPQIGFALLLLLITSGAFLFAFRSLRSQQWLAVMKDDFISNMSHELKTPLATLQVAVEAMQQMEPSVQNNTLAEYLSITAQELTRLDLLLNKIINSMLPGHASMPLHLKPIRVSQLIEQTIQTLGPVLEQRHASVKCQHAVEDIFINGDEVQLQGILYNLFDNSLKYGKQDPVITIEFFQLADKVTILFSDDGPGISADYLDKVFDKFFRVPTGNIHTVKGYGLGLHYVRQVMSQHHGTITVKNPATGGCCFTLIFPALS